MILFFTFITIIYVLLIGSFIYGFDKVKSFNLVGRPSITQFSIIIPFRNEAENITALLDSLKALNYPKDKFEIILVDDASEDNSMELIKDHISKNNSDDTLSNIKIIKNNRGSNSPKKDAITSAIHQAKNEWIVTTDADCIFPKYWLNSFDCFIQNNTTKFIVAPVTYYKVNSFLKRFQILDLLSLIGVTIGGFGIQKPFLCNGANLAYNKSFFKTLNGFEGNSNIASGDDIFLLEKAVIKEPNHVHYLKTKHAVVLTKPQQDFADLLSQRVRWASKTSSYNNWFGKLCGLTVLAMNISLITILIFTSFGVLSFTFFLCLFIIKMSIDFLLIFKTSRFFNQEEFLLSYIFSGVLYPFFSVYVAFISIFKGYKWKGRHFSK